MKCVHCGVCTLVKLETANLVHGGFESGALSTRRTLED